MIRQWIHQPDRDQIIKAVQAIGVIAILVVLSYALVQSLGDGEKNADAKKLEAFQAFDDLGLQQGRARTSIKAANADFVKKDGGQYGDGKEWPPYGSPSMAMGWPRPGENMTADQAGADYKVYPPNDQFKKAIRSGAIQEDPTTRKNIIKSSKNYGFKSYPPPKESVRSSSFNAYPAVRSGKFTYRVVEDQECAVEPMARLIDMIVDDCDAQCSNDTACLAYSYNFQNGTCKTFGTCSHLRTASRIGKTNLFVKS